MVSPEPRPEVMGSREALLLSKDVLVAASSAAVTHDGGADIGKRCGQGDFDRSGPYRL